jgi:hypothetical protein
MIGTRSTIRLFVASITLFALVPLWGCHDTPISVPGGGSSTVSPSLDAMALPQDHKSDQATTVGTVDEIDYAAMRLRVGTLWFRADGETEIEIDDCGGGCSFGDIAAGDAVKVKHECVPDASGSYYAREIEVENENEQEEQEVDEAETAGTVTAVDGSRFEVSGAWFWVDTATEFEVDECAAGPLVVGDVVKVEHSTSATTGLGFYAFKVEIDRECVEQEPDE